MMKIQTDTKTVVYVEMIYRCQGLLKIDICIYLFTKREGFMLRKKALAFAVAFALILPMAYVPVKSYADTGFINRSEEGRVVRVEGVTEISQDFIDYYKETVEELYLSAPDNKSIDGISKLGGLKKLKTLSIKSDNISINDLKDAITVLPSLSKIELKSRNSMDLGSISKEMRLGSQKIEEIVQDVHIKEAIKKDVVDVPLKIKGEAVNVSADAMVVASTDAMITVSTDPSLGIQTKNGIIDNSDRSKIRINDYDELVENGPVTLILSYNKTTYNKQHKDIEHKGYIFLKLNEREFDVTVENGASNKTVSKANEVITLTADRIKNGQKFDKWVSEDVEITNAESYSNASFTMPKKDVKVKAVYKDFDKISNLEVTTDTMLMTTVTTDVQLKITPDEYTDVITWSSSNEGVATVLDKGNGKTEVTAKAKGEALITARTSTNITAYINLKVETSSLPDIAEIEAKAREEAEKAKAEAEAKAKEEAEKAKLEEKESSREVERDRERETDKKSDSKDKQNSNSNPSTPAGGGSSSSPSTSGGGGGGGSSSKPNSIQKIAEIPSKPVTEEKAQENIAERLQGKTQDGSSEQEVAKEVKVADKMTITEAQTKVNSLNDIDDITWSKEAVVKVVQKGIMQGNKGKFMPKNTVTRAEVAQVIANIIGEKSQTNIAVSDVKSNKWYAEAVQTVLENKIFTKDERGNFRPQSKITRAELFVVIAKFKGVKPLDQDKAKEVLSNYKDVDSIPKWALGYVSALVEKGIVNGSDNKINANDNLTREQLATIFANIVK